MAPRSQPVRSSRGGSPSDDAPTAVFPAPAPAPPVEVESVAPTLASSDQCANCGAALASDQHYCLICGERRGPARFSSIPATAGVAPAIIAERSGAPRPPRFSSAATLIAGVATLLIAMGIGVYIGGLGKTSNSAARPQIVTVSGGGVAAPTASSATTAAAQSSGGSGAKKKSGSASKASSASQVVTTVKNLPPPTVTVGASGSGKGYQKGKFTGHFFGP